MAQKLASWMRKGSSFLTPSGSSASLNDPDSFAKATQDELFPRVNPAVDGEDCDHDCASCSIKYPAKFSIDEDEKLYGHVKGWSTHLLVATGKTDWVRDIADEKGSVMEAVDKAPKPANGVCVFICFHLLAALSMSYESRLYPSEQSFTRWGRR